MDGPGRLAPDFAVRVEDALAAADRARRRRAVLQRLRLLLPAVLLVGPLAAWRLMQLTPGGPHAVIDALAQWTFVLDVGVRTNSGILGYLGLQSLPTFIGLLLLVLITGGLLTGGPKDR